MKNRKEPRTGSKHMKNGRVGRKAATMSNNVTLTNIGQGSPPSEEADQEIPPKLNDQEDVKTEVKPIDNEPDQVAITPTEKLLFQRQPTAQGKIT